MATWVEASITPPLQYTPARLVDAKWSFSRENENVIGLVVSVGGNGSNRKLVPKKTYYWHL